MSTNRIKGKNADAELIKVKNHIFKIAPYIKDIEIRVDKICDEQYECLINIHVAKKNNLIACKKGRNFNESLEKAHQAALNQLGKRKKSKSKHRHEDLMQVSA